MTVKEFADSYGITPSAVYKRLKVNGLKISDLRSEGSPELSTSGLEKLKALFPTNQVENQVESSDQVVNQLTEQVENLKRQVEELKSERDFLRLSLERQQQLTALTMSRLPEPASEKKSFIQRLFSRKGSDNQ